MGAPVGFSISASSGNVANASAIATLPAATASVGVGRTTYISGFTLTASGATAGLAVVATVTGLLNGTLSYIFTAATGATLGSTPLAVNFDPPLPASAVNTAIVVTLPGLGLGNTNACASANGFQI